MRQSEVKIRNLRPGDKYRLAELMNNKKIWDNIRDYIPFPYTETDAEFFINLTQKNSHLHNFAIDYNNEFCGITGLVLQNDIYRKTAEVGYWVGEPFWGLGIATEAVRIITKYGFETLNLIRIQAGVFEFNVGSMRVLEKNGYKKDAIFKKAIIKNEIVMDEYRYSILKENFKS